MGTLKANIMDAKESLGLNPLSANTLHKDTLEKYGDQSCYSLRSRLHNEEKTSELLYVAI